MHEGGESVVGLTRQMLTWATTGLDGDARVAEVRALHAGEGPWLLRIESARQEVEVVLRAPTSRIDEDMIATNVAALTLAEQHALPTPRLLGVDLDGPACGVPVSVETVVAGSSAWPARVSADRLRAAGAAIARTHRVLLEPGGHLPVRPRPIAVDDFARERRLGRLPTTPLLERADALIRGITAAHGSTVFVHGDVWPGNMIWRGSTCRALIDWKTAGVGDPGVDLGELRKQVAMANGPDAPRHVLEGWESASGIRAEDVPYWDAVAALNTPTECDPPRHTAPRDEFLRTALEQL